MSIMNFIKSKYLYAIVLVVLVLNLSCRSSQGLFQNNSENWKRGGDATWTFANNELVGTVNEGNGFIMTEATYSDFILELDFKPDNTVNSGVFIRCKALEISATDCHEINIWDLHPNQDNRTGAIVTKAVPLVKVNTNNKWNTYKIKAQGGRVQVWINDIMTADYTDKTLSQGHVGLQTAETGEIRFRNVKITPLNTY